MSSTTTYSTKNTKNNRKVVTADYNFPKAIFKIPDGLDLEDKTLVQEWFVKKMYLNIIYVDGTCEEIPWEWDPTEEGVDWKYPDFQIEDAEDCGIDYSEDEKEEDEDKEVEVKYPTIEEILSKMKELEEDEKKWDDDTVYDAICEWDDKFHDDPNWDDEEDTDEKDSLRDRVCMRLGLGEFKKEEDEEEEEDDEENTTKCECCGAINACAFPEGYELVKKAE